MAIDTVGDLLAAIGRLPEPERVRAHVRVDRALELPAPACRAALGLLALELADAPAAPAARLSA